jgi:uncharacterized protein
MATPPLVVSITALRRGHEHRRREQRAGRIPGLRITGSAVPERAEVAVDAVIELVDGGVLVTGTVRAPWVGECRRCLVEVQGDLVAPVRELYEGPSGHRHAASADSDDDETYPLHGDQLDLTPLARDAVLLELPQAPLCRDDCAGLCPTCGADRNGDPCGCPEQPGDSPWGVLDALRPGGTA